MSQIEIIGAIVEAWARGLNTVEIAKLLGKIEAEIANLLGYLRGASQG